MKQKEHERKTLYIIGWMLLAIGMLIFFIVKISGISFDFLLLPCIIHELTHLYCPGCGGTRAAILFFQGNFLQSCYYHPFVIYSIAVCGWFMVSNTIEWMSKGHLKIGMYYKNRYAKLGVGILVVNFIIKNAALLIFHYPMIP